MLHDHNLEVPVHSSTTLLLIWHQFHCVSTVYCSKQISDPYIQKSFINYRCSHLRLLLLCFPSYWIFVNIYIPSFFKHHINLFKPAGYYTYQQIKNFKILHADCIAFECFVWLSEATVPFALHFNNRLVFITEAESNLMDFRPCIMV
jgi:hypothetical protein